MMARRTHAAPREHARLPATHRVVAVRDDGRAREFGRYPSQQAATETCCALLKVGLSAYVERLPDSLRIVEREA